MEFCLSLFVRFCAQFDGDRRLIDPEGEIVEHRVDLQWGQDIKRRLVHCSVVISISECHAAIAFICVLFIDPVRKVKIPIIVMILCSLTTTYRLFEGTNKQHSAFYVGIFLDMFQQKKIIHRYFVIIAFNWLSLLVTFMGHIHRKHRSNFEAVLFRPETRRDRAGTRTVRKAGRVLAYLSRHDERVLIIDMRLTNTLYIDTFYLGVQLDVKESLPWSK
mmetsp:Transcript_29078/g.57822  ORF Transcript_29078/g.57822 Transcript_29078/m.57822 type:complete len:218 (+) Transcript_29078:1170-1823(+)